MTEKEIRSLYPVVETLYKLIEENEIQLTALPKTKSLEDISFREIDFLSPSYTCTLPVDDEYKDADLDNQALLLQLIIFAIEEYEDCDDFLVWCTAFGLNASDSLSLVLFKRTGEIVPKIRAIIGTDFHGISDYDWQLNAGAAQALRELEV